MMWLLRPPPSAWRPAWRRSSCRKVKQGVRERGGARERASRVVCANNTTTPNAHAYSKTHRMSVFFSAILLRLDGTL